MNTTISFTKAAPVAFSYIRFSSASQGKEGKDSFRRQTALAIDWCEKNKIPLDPSTFHDLGVSGYTGEHRENPDRNALALFLQGVEQGKIPKGSFLLVENLDRLSREHVMVALHLLTGLIQKGITVVQLSPQPIVFDKQAEPMNLMFAVMEMSRGHSESKMKSERIGKAWGQKKKLARETGKIVTNTLPAWIEQDESGKLVIVETAGKAVRRIYELCIAGYGCGAIVGKLKEEKHKPIGRTGLWYRSYVNVILTCEQTIGTYSPILKKTGEPDGAAILNYYPAVISKETYYQAQLAKKNRYRVSGRKSKKSFNFFSGLMVNFADPSDRFSTHSKIAKNGEEPKVVYINNKGKERVSPPSTFPQRIFDMCFFNYFREVKTAEVIGQDTTSEELTAVSGELTKLELNIAKMQVELQEGGEFSLVKTLRAWEARAEELKQHQHRLRQETAHPRAEVFGETQNLLSVALWENRHKDADEMKNRLRSCLKRVIDKIYCTFGGTRQRRTCVAQITFHGSKVVRIFKIDYRAISKNKEFTREESWTAGTILSERMLTAVEVAQVFPC